MGVLAKSQGLVADGIHSLADLVADFVVLFAGHHAAKDADQEHPYGHQRFETAASFVLGLLLGPTGNLRAPTLRKGRTLLVGFDEATYARVLG